MLLHRLNVRAKPTWTFWVAWEQKSDKTQTPQNRLCTYSGTTSECLIILPDFFHLIYEKRAVKLDWDTSGCKLLRTLRSHWLTLQGSSELSAHWVCSMESSPKCSFSLGSWCVHIGVNKRNLLVQWRYKFACKVAQPTSPMFTFFFKVN